MRTSEHYKDWFYRHMPRGPVWPQDAQSTPVWDSLLDALAQEPARIDAYIFDLLKAFIPSAVMGEGMLDVWETLLNLTPQIGDSAETRATAIMALLGQYLSPSLPEIQAYADLFGVGAAITQHEYPLFVMGVSAMGAPLRGDQWAHTWTVTYNAPQSGTFEASIRAVAPQHTTVLFVVTP